MNIIETVENGMRKALDCDLISIGKSVCGNDILCAHRGDYTGNQIIITAAIHARECYSALVVLKQIREFEPKGNGGAYFIPLVNPDGALFFESGDTQGNAMLERHKSLNRVWKANADGVDLNCNFDANWGTGVQNTRVAGASNYIGEYPLCAPETNALARFTREVSPRFTVSYHCMGGELYWQFYQRGAAKRRDKKLATAVARKIGVKRVDGELNSAGGYKDFCVQKLGIPAVTIELIKKGEHPFEKEHFDRDIRLNACLPNYILDKLSHV